LKEAVEEFATNREAFYDAFRIAFEKMSVLGAEDETKDVEELLTGSHWKREMQYA
jgi:hypothetical protein